MYLNPPCSNLQELRERIARNEIFRVYKRWVNERNRDKSYKRGGFSRVILEDGMDVTVTIFNNGTVKEANPTEEIPEVPVSNVSNVPNVLPKPAVELSYSELKAHMMATEERINAEKARKFEEDAWNEVYNNLHLEIDIHPKPQQ
jgi:hypothetical protein